MTDNIFQMNYCIVNILLVLDSRILFLYHIKFKIRMVATSRAG